MPATVFDSAIFRDVFGTPPMRAIFADEALVARYVAVEVALATAEANAGVIPKEAAEAIKRAADPAAIDLAKLKAETDIVGYPIVGVVRRPGSAARPAATALGRHHAGHHGHRHRPAGARRAGADPRRARGHGAALAPQAESIDAR